MRGLTGKLADPYSGSRPGARAAKGSAQTPPQSPPPTDSPRASPPRPPPGGHRLRGLDADRRGRAYVLVAAAWGHNGSFVLVGGAGGGGEPRCPRAELAFGPGSVFQPVLGKVAGKSLNQQACY